MLQCEKEHGASKNARCSSVAYHRFFAICLLAVILESPYSRVHGLDTPMNTWNTYNADVTHACLFIVFGSKNTSICVNSAPVIRFDQVKRSLPVPRRCLNNFAQVRSSF